MTYISWSSDFCFISWRLFDVWTSYFGILTQYDPTLDLKINVDKLKCISCSSDFALSWRVFDVWTSLRDYESVWPDVWPQNKCRSLWPIFHGPVILPYILKTFWCMNIILRDYESVWWDIWPQKNVGHCDLYFMVQWLFLISWRLFDVWTSYFLILCQYDTTLDLKINVGHCCVYFMVQWFCLTSWRLFDIWTPYFGIMSKYDLTFDLRINVGHCDQYFMVQWLSFISWRLFDVWTSYFGIMSQYDMTFDFKIL